MTERGEQFNFEISLSVLDHLGRNLYRSFITVMGEAVSNAWDADSKNVWIDVDKRNNTFSIKDDGIGMSSEDFQDKFLKIGYSKRHGGEDHSPDGRPYIGRKGIGKLALLSCSERISIVTKTSGGDYVGGVIDNAGLTAAIDDDLIPSDYPLSEVNLDDFSDLIAGHDQGTIIKFEGLYDGIRNNLDYLEKIIALYFKFSLLDDEFNIYLNGELITYSNLSDLKDNTEFLWKINGVEDPFVEMLESEFTEDNEIESLNIDADITGFIASVEKPRHLKIISTEERAGVDLFVNGRLRERDILKHITTSRIAESYLYGQVHFNSLDDEIDRFTSSREGVVSDDEKYKAVLAQIRSSLLLPITDRWDEWRVKHREDGDQENNRITPRERKSKGLFNEVSNQYASRKGTPKTVVDTWLGELSKDAVFNFDSYAECFVAENLVRKSINHQGNQIDTRSTERITHWRGVEETNKQAGNLSIDIRSNNDDLFYLEMERLVRIADTERGHNNTLLTDEKQFTPIRDAVMHTSLLTDEAKRRLTVVFENIKARVKTILDSNVT